MHLLASERRHHPFEAVARTTIECNCPRLVQSKTPKYVTTTAIAPPAQRCLLRAWYRGERASESLCMYVMALAGLPSRNSRAAALPICYAAPPPSRRAAGHLLPSRCDAEPQRCSAMGCRTAKPQAAAMPICCTAGRSAAQLLHRRAAQAWCRDRSGCLPSTRVEPPKAA